MKDFWWCTPSWAEASKPPSTCWVEHGLQRQRVIRELSRACGQGDPKWWLLSVTYSPPWAVYFKSVGHSPVAKRANLASSWTLNRESCQGSMVCEGLKTDVEIIQELQSSRGILLWANIVLFVFVFNFFFSSKVTDLFLNNFGKIKQWTCFNVRLKHKELTLNQSHIQNGKISFSLPFLLKLSCDLGNV